MTALSGGALPDDVEGTSPTETQGKSEHLGTELQRLDRLVSDEGGLINSVQRLTGEDETFAIYTATLGAIERLQSNIRVSQGVDAGLALAGSGGGTNARLARAIAIVEAVERYSSCVPPNDLRWASAADLGPDAIDITTLPRCSPSELAHPRCPVRAFDPDERIRWTTAWSSRQERLLNVPAALVWMHLEPMTASERLTVPISTGCAAHTDPAQALLNAVNEVVERDSIALTWLRRLRLPEIDLSSAPASVQDSVARRTRPAAPIVSLTPPLTSAYRRCTAWTRTRRLGRSVMW